MQFYEKYLQLCREKNVSPSKAALDMGFTKTTVSRWKKGGGITDINAITVANFFGVPVSELVGEQKESPGPEAEGVSEAKKALLELVDGLSDEQCAKLAGIIEEAKKLL